MATFLLCLGGGERGKGNRERAGMGVRDPGRETDLVSSFYKDTKPIMGALPS